MLRAPVERQMNGGDKLKTASWIQSGEGSVVFNRAILYYRDTLEEHFQKTGRQTAGRKTAGAEIAGCGNTATLTLLS